MASDENFGEQLAEVRLVVSKELAEVRHLVTHLVRVNGIEDILCRGIETVSAQLEPLRDLAPQRKHMQRDQPARLQSLLVSLERPEWAGATTLGIVEPVVRFIGEVVPPAPQDARRKDYLQAGSTAS